MTVDELRVEMHGEFKDVRADAAGLRSEMATEFKKVREEFAGLRHEMTEEFTNVRADIAGLRTELKSEGETTRRHFDVMVGQMRDIVKVVADGTLRNTERLDDHEERIKAIERPGAAGLK